MEKKCVISPDGYKNEVEITKFFDCIYDSCKKIHESIVYFNVYLPHVMSLRQDEQLRQNLSRYKLDVKENKENLVSILGIAKKYLEIIQSHYNEFVYQSDQDLKVGCYDNEDTFSENSLYMFLSKKGFSDTLVQDIKVLSDKRTFVASCIEMIPSPERISDPLYPELAKLYTSLDKLIESVESLIDILSPDDSEAEFTSLNGCSATMYNERRNSAFSLGPKESNNLGQ